MKEDDYMKRVIYGVRCILVEGSKIVCIKNTVEKIGYYDLPGGEIEEGETPLDACIRECKEETGIDVKEATYKGTLVINSPKMIFNLKLFVIEKYSGEPVEELAENLSMWMDIKKYLAKEKLYANAIILDGFFYKALNGNKEFEIDITVDESDKILELKFKYV